MKRVIPILFFTLFFISGLAEAAPKTLPPSPQNPVPQHNAEGVDLTADLMLVLKWEAVDKAEEYRYQFWKVGESAGDEIITLIPQSALIPAYSLQPGAKYRWRARSCADLDGKDGINPQRECSSYNSPWDFTYLLNPPRLVSPKGENASLPVNFFWNPAYGAQSYLFKGKLSLNDNWLQRFGQWGLNLIFGDNKQTVACPYTLWDDEQNSCVSFDINKNASGYLEPRFTDDVCLFTKDTKYQWQVAACLGERAKDCGQFSNESSFETNNIYAIPAPQLKEPFYDPTEPPPTAGFNDFLSLSGDLCSHYYKFILKEEGGGPNDEKAVMEMGTLRLNNAEIKDFLWRRLDKIFLWQAQPCYLNNSGIKCEESESDTWKFRTTGRKPWNLQSKVSSRVKISWGIVGKAGTYQYSLSTNQNSPGNTATTSADSAVLDYPDIRPATRYWWKVRTCADADANYCGEWSDVDSFETYPLNPPTGLGPAGGPLPMALEWGPDSGANFYKYKVDYFSTTYEAAEGPIVENLEGCYEKTGSQTVSPTIVSEPKATIYQDCLGKYQWQVQSCFDKDCRVAAPANLADAPSRIFNAFEFALGREKGIVPCGRKTNSSDTAFDEREPCQLKHFGFLSQNIIDFLLWRLGLIFLGILALITAATAFFSLGSPTTLNQIKSLWRTAAAGYLIMLLAWVLINLLMSIAGFQVQFFGRWFDMPF